MAHKHKDEITRWANSAESTNVWYKSRDGNWYLLDRPAWINKVAYIVDDEWAELRKAQADGKQLEVIIGSTWISETLLIGHESVSGTNVWRIKSKEVYEWQWIIQDVSSGKYDITNGSYTKEEAEDRYNDIKYTKLIEPYRPSKTLVSTDTKS